MNRVAKLLILSAAAVGTLVSTMPAADAADRHWRRHHVVKPWKKRVVISGVTAGVVAGTVITTRPRVIYRDDPVIVDEAPLYEEDFGDEGFAYEQPADDFDASAYDDEALPDAEDDAGAFYEDELYRDERHSTESLDGYFPAAPEASVERKSAPRRETATEKPERRPASQTESKRKNTAAAALKPWSKEWQTWCAGRFPSFNPQNGTYLGYDKKRHFCKAG